MNFSATFSGNIDGTIAAEVARPGLVNKCKEKANRILEAAKDNAPVDTGALRDSGHIEEEEVALIAEVSYKIIFDAPTTDQSKWTSYARFVEEGTSKMDAQPYLRPAILAAKD